MAAEIITTDPPDYLVNVLALMSFHISAASTITPSRAEVHSLLGQFERDVGVVYSKLGIFSLRNVLDMDVDPVQRTLHKLLVTVEKARLSPHLVDQAGKVRSGRGRAKLLPSWISGEVTAAAVVASAWAFFHEGQPRKPSSKKMAKAAEILWNAHLVRSGGVAPRSNSLDRWRDHFIAATTASAESVRRLVQRYLVFFKAESQSPK